MKKKIKNKDKALYRGYLFQSIVAAWDIMLVAMYISLEQYSTAAIWTLVSILAIFTLYGRKKMLEDRLNSETEVKTKNSLKDDVQDEETEWYDDDDYYVEKEKH